MDETSDHSRLRSLFLKWSSWHRNILPSSSSTSNNTGPVCLVICPGSHLSPLLWFLTSTLPPTVNFHSQQCLSWCSFSCHCLLFTLSSKFGLSKSNRVLSLRPTSNSEGDNEVIVCVCVGWGGVIWYWRRKQEILSEIFPVVSLWNPCLKILTPCSANPFEDGW